MRLEGLRRQKPNPRGQARRVGDAQTWQTEGRLKDAVPSWGEGLPGLEIRGADGGGMGSVRA